MKKYITLLLLLSISLFSCGKNSTQEVTTSTNIQTTQNVLESKDFDLEQVIGLISSGKIKDPAELEKTINDSSSGINNVDIDHDGNIDYISVKETSTEYIPGWSTYYDYEPFPYFYPYDPFYDIAAFCFIADVFY